MINIYYQLAGLVLTIMIAILFASKTKLLFDTDRAFFHLLMHILCALTLDIIAVNGMALYVNYMADRTFMQVLCKLFLISVVAVGYLMIRYTMIAIGREQKASVFFSHISLIPLCVFAVLALFLDVEVKTVSSTGEPFCTGAYAVLAYVFLIAYCALCAISILQHRETVFCLCDFICTHYSGSGCFNPLFTPA